MNLKGQHIAILGAARSGLAAARLAADNGARVTIFDEADTTKLARSIESAHAAGFGFKSGDEAKHAVIMPGEFQLAVLSPGFDAAWPLPAKFARAGVLLTGELEFGHARSNMRMIAITGTNGKSTTTELTSAMLNGCGLRSIPCGNHGMALCEVINSGVQYDTLALEVSSFQLETIQSFRPAISMWLNFAPDHLDRYPDEAAYFRAKYRIFENQTADDHAIINIQDVSRLGALKPKTITFSAYQEADFAYRDGQFVHQGQVIGSPAGIKLRGRHNMENILATLAAGYILGLGFGSMLGAIQSYEPPAHRCELVRELHGVEYINDSKATNLHALESCVRALEQPLVLIMGGKEKGLDYTPLRTLIPGKVQALVCIGEIAGKLHAQFADLVPCSTASSMAEAVRLAADFARPGDTVALSPGTSSFDMYSGYAARGEDFRAAVHTLS